MAAVLASNTAERYLRSADCVFAMLELDAKVVVASVGWRALPKDVLEQVIGRVRQAALRRQQEISWTTPRRDWEIRIEEWLWPASKRLDAGQGEPKEQRYAVFATPLNTDGIDAVAREECRPCTTTESIGKTRG